MFDENLKGIHINEVPKENFNENILVIIGPEGGFEEEEREFVEANSKNFFNIKLGSQILKADTHIQTTIEKLSKAYLTTCVFDPYYPTSICTSKTSTTTKENPGRGNKCEICGTTKDNLRVLRQDKPNTVKILLTKEWGLK